MAIRPILITTKRNPPIIFIPSPIIIGNLKPKPSCVKPNKTEHRSCGKATTGRRATLLKAILLAKWVIFGNNGNREEEAIAGGIDMGMMATEQSIAGAEKGVRDHAASLLRVRELLESESWREAQLALRRSASNLKLDLYTFIQSKPGVDRPHLRVLYSTLFDTVTQLHHAAKDHDVSRAWQFYDNTVAALDAIMSELSF